MEKVSEIEWTPLKPDWKAMRKARKVEQLRQQLKREFAVLMERVNRE